MIRLQESYWQPIHTEIQNFFWLQFFDPIFDILNIRKPFQNSSLSNLQQAMGSGRVFYQNGVFSGKFDIRTSKELSEFATFDGRSRTWVGMPPPQIIATAALRMPVTKLFGMSASGFNSGEDDLESYNQMVESEIQRPLNRMVKAMFDLSFAYLFDYVPKFRFKWPTMRVLTETEHQEVLDKAANRLLSFYDRGLIQTPAVEAEAKKAGIFTTNMNMVINPVPPNGPESVPGGAPSIKANQKGFFNEAKFEEDKHPRADDGKFGKGGGSIDQQLDRYHKQEATRKAGEEKVRATRFKEDKALAKDLYAVHKQDLLDSMKGKYPDKQLKEIFDGWIQREPRKLILVISKLKGQL